MKPFKMISFFLALLAIGFSSCFAQSSVASFTEEQKEQLANSLEEYYAVLDLTEEQKAEFEAITQKYAGKMLAVKNGGGSKWKKYSKVKDIRKNKDAEMEALLTDDQYPLYLEKQKELQAKMKEKRNQI